MTNASPFLQAYLFAYVLWFELALGCLGLYMIHPLVGGAWGVLLQPVFKAGLRSIWVLVPLFVPIALEASRIFPWLDAATVAASPAIQQKLVYLNLAFFLARAAFYFSCWLGLAYFLVRIREPRRLARLCAGGLVLYGFTVSFALVDWVMSLEPQWYSTLFGLLMIVTQGLAAMAFAVGLSMRTATRNVRAGFYSQQLMRDLGNLLLVFVMVAAYLSFMQYLIQWSGNLPKEVIHYSHRSQGGWQWLALAIFILQFCAPFIGILFRRIKQRPQGLGAIALTMLAGFTLNIYWVVKPMFSPDVLRVHAWDILLTLLLGAVWLSVYSWNARKVP